MIKLRIVVWFYIAAATGSKPTGSDTGIVLGQGDHMGVKPRHTHIIHTFSTPIPLFYTFPNMLFDLLESERVQR